MRTSFIIITIICLTVIYGCTSGRISNSQTEENNQLKGKIRGEAYLFDVKLKRDGKPTSFRLEIYNTDSITAFSGRGYLGKGALKGIIDDDSILVYFPTSNEFLNESTTTLLDLKDCINELEFLNLFELMTNLPTDIKIDSNLSINSSFENTSEPQFELYNPSCSWNLNLSYDKRKTGWRLKSFSIDDGISNNIKATRRTYKHNAKIPYKRFNVNIPDNAYRIIP